jgi:hypothetical protein
LQRHEASTLRKANASALPDYFIFLSGRGLRNARRCSEIAVDNFAFAEFPAAWLGRRD